MQSERGDREDREAEYEYRLGELLAFVLLVVILLILVEIPA